jgi:cell division protein DivIC
MRSGGQGVSRIHNDYVTSKELSEKIRRKRRRGLIRRLLAFAILLAFCIGSLSTIIHNQYEKMGLIQQQKLQVNNQLASANSEEKSLQLQIKLLHDKNYIGELAREKYLMSKKGEIIFASPKSNEH